MEAYLKCIAKPTQYKNFGQYSTIEQLQDEEGFEKVTGPLPDNMIPYRILNPLEQVDDIITSGINQFANNPLPQDLEAYIFQLSVFVKQYYQYNRINLIRNTIENFNISDDRDDVTLEQKEKISFIKAQLLELFPDE